jgi:hypothetical protein
MSGLPLLVYLCRTTSSVQILELLGCQGMLQQSVIIQRGSRIQISNRGICVQAWHAMHEPASSKWYKNNFFLFVAMQMCLLTSYMDCNN